MALQATHFRIAKDLAETIEIKDLEAYYCGALYPDSRYRTDIPRSDTHGPQCPHNPFDPSLTDFEKGWATHLLYDEISGAMQKAIMPTDMIHTMNLDHTWAYFTAIKIVEDMFCVDAIGTDISILTKLVVQETPNNELIDILYEHYSSLDTLYGSQSPSFEHHQQQFLDMNLPKAIIADMRLIAEELMQNETEAQKIKTIYDETLRQILAKQTSI